MKYKVIAFDDPDVPFIELERYKEIGAELTLVHWQALDEWKAACMEADAVYSPVFLEAFDRDLLEKMKRCRVICCAGIGYDHVDVEAATECGILVTNAPDYCLEEVSDHTIALIVTLTRRIVPQILGVREGKWNRVVRAEIQKTYWDMLPRFQDQILGLVGLGKIGRNVARKAKGLGLRVIAYDPYLPGNIAEELGVAMVQFDSLLEEADIVSLHTGLTRETRHLIGMRELRKMKNSAYLVNVSRGAIVDERALITAISNGYIRGAGLDVTSPEPPLSDSPLLKMENVLITPHSAYYSNECDRNLRRQVEEEIFRVLRGEWPNCLVNPTAKENYEKKWAHK